MKPKIPNACPQCGKRHLTMTSVTSRVFATWRCESCGQEWTADAATGRLISRQSAARNLEGASNAKA